jgi:beta-lactamase regulating signal transducer with metallopeptidase domain
LTRPIAVALSCGIALTLLLRTALRTLFGPGIAYLIWLLVPASLLAMMPSVQILRLLSLPAALSVSLTAISSLASGLPAAANSSGIDWRMCFVCIWAAGALIVGLGLARQQRRFVASLGVLHASGGMFRAASSGCPVAVGLFRPKVVLPVDFEARYTVEEQALILAHEHMHLRRGDLIINAAWAIARGVFWFNPLTHIASSAIRVDQELACDAAVMRDHPKSRRAYARAMLNTQLIDTPPLLGCCWQPTHPLKERIMLLKRASPRGLRSALGRVFVGIAVSAVGYGAWAVQPADIAEPSISITADSVVGEATETRYFGNVVMKVVGRSDVIPMNLTAGNAKMTAHREPGYFGDLLIEGDVNFQIGSRKFATDKATVQIYHNIRIFKMDTLRALQ